MRKVEVNIKQNGQFDIYAGGIIIKNCYPGINDMSVRPLKVDIVNTDEGKIVKYMLTEGVIELLFMQKGEQLEIITMLCGFDELPHSFFPIFAANISNVEGGFKQGFGTEGTSGFFTLTDNEEFDIESYGLLVLNEGNNNCFITTFQHDKFIQFYRVEICPLRKEFHKLYAGYRTEEIICKQLILPALAIYLEENLDCGLKRAALKNAVTKDIKLIHRPAYYWCSWYYRYYHFCHEDLLNYLNEFSKYSTDIPFEFIQIDAGYFNSPGDWMETNWRWPEGLKPAFDEIKRYGYKPGIWIAPYMVGNRSKIFRQHPDWVLCTREGNYVTQMQYFGEWRLWGMQDEEYYVLDTSHPQAMEYICDVFKKFKEWGARFFKTDFMLWGIQDSSKVCRHTPGKTSIEYFVDLLKEIKKILGQECFWLGCIAPFLPFLGYADGMRIAGDVGPQWSKGFGPVNMLTEISADQYFNHVYWQNDPDAILLRDFNIHLSEEERTALALLQALSGGMIYTSDPIHQLSDASRELLSFIYPKSKVNPTMPFLGRGYREIIFIHNIPEIDRYIVFFFNPTDTEIVNLYTIESLTGKKELYLQLWNTGEYTKERREQIFVRMNAHGYLLFFASEKTILDKKFRNLWR